MTAQQRKRAAEIRALVVKDRKLKLWLRADAFMRANGLQPGDPQAVFLLAAQLQDCLAETTAADYFRNMQPYLLTPVEQRSSLILRRVVKLTAGRLHLRAAKVPEQDRRRAIDVPFRVVRDTLRSIAEEESPEVAIGCYLIAAGSFRAADLADVQPWNMTITHDDLQFTAYTSKGARKRDDRAFHTIPFHVSRLKIPTHLAQWWASAHEVTMPTDSGRYNRVLRSHVTEAAFSDITTYSLRRFFANAALAACDWDAKRAAALYTRHKNSNVLRAYYDARLS